MHPDIRIDGSLASITFGHFDLDAYELFLRSKKLPESQLTYDWEADRYTVTTPARFAAILGATVPIPDRTRSPLADHLFDYQQWAVEMALDAKRFALWADTGLGKTAMYLDWTRQVREMTGGRVLILTPLAIIPQVVREAERFDAGDVYHLETREAVAHWCRDGRATDTGPELPSVAITNYEKFIAGVMPELRYLTGIVADESGILKTGGGTIKWNLIMSARGIEYKLSCTATPAPNEAMEYASQAAFLEKLRNEGDILWTYFQRDKYGVWSVKPHAKSAFYAFMASWSLYMRDPAAFGFGDILADLPAPVMVEERIPMTGEQQALYQAFAIASGKGLFAEDRLGVKERSKLAQIARGFVYEGTGKGRTIQRVNSAKVTRVVDATCQYVIDGHQVLIWTTFDEEGEVIRDAMGAWPGVAILSGSQDPTERERILATFRRGEMRSEISGTVTGDPLQIKVEQQYFVDFLNEAKSGAFTFHANASNQAMRFTSPSLPDYSYVAMPILVGGE